MNITGYPIEVSSREGATDLLAARGRQVPGIAGVVDQTDLLPNIMDLSDNVLLAHYQRERR
jgi:hypothetical protein